MSLVSSNFQTFLTRNTYTVKNDVQVTVVWLTSPVLYGTTYGCFLNMSIWQYTEVKIIVDIQVAVSFTGGGNWSTHRKLAICR
jgi:hypothetical protein